ncbi:hypothetical protein [Flavilitoribacter nigricans]|uniref:UrcA family protein n=1 Tax=Flavilitoribacter nigricans (strain ATCC 23147 / DSM 23189 / NBRC 102662 / NCIMB 1420 / SS-2) TaxID=1122177 RepID=A0A2D0N8E2_FLAN2|nr:hypothetical protein [Flavilitoribacter nigricans]PHN04782.1 hypothetical protein CRP01_19925 [Flavilitoribacter nigricans DSM 23189 = NBRC 102662]
MKILLAIFFGVLLNGLGAVTASEQATRSDTTLLQPVSIEAEYCFLSITGYANFDGMRMEITLTAEAETCEEAAAAMKKDIIEREIRIAY